MQALKLRHSFFGSIELEVWPLFLSCPYIYVSPTPLVELDPKPDFSIHCLHSDRPTLDGAELSKRNLLGFEPTRNQLI